MRRLVAIAAAMFGAGMACASPGIDRLVDALGVPALIEAFAVEGQDAGVAINDRFLNGQGGAVWGETVRRLYDPARLEADLRAALQDKLDPETTAQALLFLQSDLGEKAVDLEVQARRAMLNDDVEAAAKSAPSAGSDAVSDFLTVRDLIERNTDTALAAQVAFFDGLAATSGQAGDMPDHAARRDALRRETERWLRGYYALAHAPLSADEVAILTAFWDTDVGRAVDDALFAAVRDSYVTLSFAMGQAVGRLLPQNEL